MKKLLQLLIVASACLVGAGAWAATEVVATFKGFTKAENGGYSATVNGEAVASETIVIDNYPILLTRTTGWGSSDGLSILVKYKNLPATLTAESGFLSFAPTGVATTPYIGMSLQTTKYVRARTSGNNVYWSNGSGVTGLITMPENGYVVFAYGDSHGSSFYTETGGLLYKHTGLLYSEKSSLFTTLSLGGFQDGSTTCPVLKGLEIEGARVYKGKIATLDEIASAVKDFEMVELEATITTADILTAYSGHDYWNGKDEIWVKVPVGATITFSANTTLPNAVKLYGDGDITFMKSEGVSDVSSELAKIEVVTGTSHLGWAQTRTAMLESGANITSWAEMGWDTIPSDTDNVVITLKGDATLNLATPQTIGEVTIQKAEEEYTGTAEKPTLTINGTLRPSKVTVNGAVYTLAGTSGSSEETPTEITYPIVDGTNPGGIKVTSGVVKLTAATHTGGTQIDSNAILIYNDGATIREIDGQGTLSLIGWIPSNAQLTLADTWKGVVKISDYGMNSDVEPLSGLQGLTNDNSTLEVSDVRGYVNKSDNLTISHLKISENKYFQLWNGTETESNRAVIQVNKLSGTGTFKWTGYPNPNSDAGWAYTVKIVDVCDFSGRFKKNATDPIDGDDATAIVIGDAAGSTTGTNKKITFCGNVSFNATTVPTFEAEDGIAFAADTTINVKLSETFEGAIKIFSTSESITGNESATVKVYVGTNLLSFDGTLSKTEEGLFVTNIILPAGTISGESLIAGQTYVKSTSDATALTGDLPAVTILVKNGQVDLSGVTSVATGAKFQVDLTDVTEVAASPFTNVPAGLNVTFEAVGTDPFGVFGVDSATGAIIEDVKPLPYQITWMPMGDSITEGEKDMGQSVGTGTDASRGGYRYQLWNYLENGVGEGSIRQDVKSVGFRLAHGGLSGANVVVENPNDTDWAWHAASYGARITPLTTSAAQLYNVETAFENAGYPEIVSLMIGINDLADTRDSSRVFTDWTNLVQKIAMVRPHSKIVVSSVLPTGTGNSTAHFTPFNNLIRNGFAATEKVAPFDNPNVIFVDVCKLAFHDTFDLQYYKNTGNPADKVHPNETGSKLVAKAFRLGFLKAIKDIQGQDKDGNDITPLAITQVHNGESGKVVVRLNKPVNPQDYDTLTLALDGKSSATLNKVASDSTESTRELYFDASLYDFTFGQFNEATIKNFASTSIQAITSNANTHMDICGSGAEANVPDSFRSGFAHYKTIEIGFNNGASGDGNADKETYTAPTTTIPNNAVISRVGYYLELKRENQPAQFIWVSMDATAFGNNIANVGIPYTGKSRKEKVSNLAVFGNRGNFEKSVTEGEGIIEFTPYSYVVGDSDEFPADLQASSCGWNDTLKETDTGGCMQIARIRTTEEGGDLAEMLFAYNQFTHTTYQTDLGIGSFSVNLSNKINQNSVYAAYDWTYVGYMGYDAYIPSAYKVRNLEIWVELAPKEAWIGGAADAWSDDSNWLDDTAPTSLNNIEIVLQAGSTLTLPEGTYSTVFSGDGALAIPANATVTLSGENTYTGGTQVGDNATLTFTGTSPNSGAFTGNGEVCYAATTAVPTADLFSSETADSTEADPKYLWKGTVCFKTVSKDNIDFETYSNPTSKIKLDGLTGWIAQSAATGTAAGKTMTFDSLEIVAGGWHISNGISGNKTTLMTKLMGQGLIKMEKSGTDTDDYPPNFSLVVDDVSKFAGDITLVRRAGVGHEGGQFSFLIGQGAHASEKIQIASDKIANLAAGKTWSANGGVSVLSGGTLKVGVNNTESTPVVGTVSGGLSMAEGSTLQVNLIEAPSSGLKVLATTGTGTVTLGGATKVTLPGATPEAPPVEVGGWTTMKGTNELLLRRKGFMLMIK